MPCSGEAPEILHGQEQRVVVAADLVDRDDVVVPDGGRGLGLAHEAIPDPGRTVKLGLDDLQGDGPGELRVLGQEDEANAALADEALDPVLGQPAELALGARRAEEVEASRVGRPGVRRGIGGRRPGVARPDGAVR